MSEFSNLLASVATYGDRDNCGGSGRQWGAVEMGCLVLSMSSSPFKIQEGWFYIDSRHEKGVSP